MKKIISVVGARPNFMKIAPLCRAFAAYATVRHILVHTGQHYDAVMSQVFFDELDLPPPDIYLGAGSGSHAQQTALIMTAFEKVCEEQQPDLVVVVGDVNSTLACSIVAAKQTIPIAHIEAGLRSFDRTMPEEINRIVTDRLASYLFVTEHSGVENLRREGAPDDKIFFVGNTMIDTLVHARNRALTSGVVERFDLVEHAYCVVTLHRPSNVDSKDGIRRIIELFERLAESVDILFPIHPRTRKMLESFGLAQRAQAIKRLRMAEPLGYLDFLRAMETAAFVLTDSGGIQEETTFLGVPCITMRDNTERPITIEQGTNVLAGSDTSRVYEACESALKNRQRQHAVPKLWDGHAAARVAEIIMNSLED